MAVVPPFSRLIKSILALPWMPKEVTRLTIDAVGSESSSHPEQMKIKGESMTKRGKTEDRGVFDVIEGLTPVDPSTLKAFVNAMTEEVIPEIVRVVDERRKLAAESRKWQLKS